MRDIYPLAKNDMNMLIRQKYEKEIALRKTEQMSERREGPNHTGKKEKTAD